MKNDQELTRDREIFRIMRKVLSQVAKETATEPGLKHPLSQRCIDDIRQCLALIAARENELAQLAGVDPERPYFSDEAQSQQAQVISINSIKNQNKNKPS